MKFNLKDWAMSEKVALDADAEYMALIKPQVDKIMSECRALGIPCAFTAVTKCSEESYGLRSSVEFTDNIGAATPELLIAAGVQNKQGSEETHEFVMAVLGAAAVRQDEDLKAALHEVDSLLDKLMA